MSYGTLQENCQKLCSYCFLCFYSPIMSSLKNPLRKICLAYRLMVINSLLTERKDCLILKCFRFETNVFLKNVPLISICLNTSRIDSTSKISFSQPRNHDVATEHYCCKSIPSRDGVIKNMIVAHFNNTLIS